MIATLLAPLWLDPVTLGELRGQPASPSASVEPIVEDPPDGRPRRTPGLPVNTHELAADDFERRVRGGFGDADAGGPYAISNGSAQVEVLSGRATVRVSADAMGQGILDSATGHELDASVTVTLDRPARDGEAAAALVLRAAPGVAYRPGIAFAGDLVGVVIDVVAGGTARRVAGPIELTGVTIGTDAIRIRAHVSGSDPATVSVRAWPAAQPEPTTWTLSIIDWTGRLQQPGASGLAWHRLGGAGRAPLVLTFDDLTVSTGDSVAAQ